MRLLLAIFVCVGGLSTAPASAQTAYGKTYRVVTMTAADADAVRRQIKPHWNVPIGASCSQQVPMFISLTKDGTVTSMDLAADLSGEPGCEAFAEAARRAIRSASPLKLPAGEDGANIMLSFNPFLN
jgi:hypothetical protein